MTEFESLSRGVDHLGNIERTLGDLQGSKTTIYELIQNADDAPNATEMRFTVSDEALEVWNDGIFDRCSDVTSPECEWLPIREHRCDFHSFRKMASGDKRNRPGTTGAFGVGFTAVYQFTDRPELISNGEHWFVDEMAPEQDRIQRARTSVEHTGTTFRLPWARLRSPFRLAVRQEPITEQGIRSFINDLWDAVPRAMPFLRKLKRITARSGAHAVGFERWATADRIGVRADDGTSHEWTLLAGEFDMEASELKAAHTGVIEDARGAHVAIAIPRGDAPSGLLYATLPTEEASHLPLLINADFIPASDRKRLRFDASAVSDWNRAALRCAARLLAQRLDSLPSEIGDESVVRLLIAARDLGRRLASEQIDLTFGAFWAELVRQLPNAQIVPIEGGGHGTVGAVRLWAEEVERRAAGLMRELGTGLVDARVRADWYQLRGGDVGIRTLHLSDLAAGLRAHGLTRRWAPDDQAGALATVDGIEALWSLMDLLLEVRDRSNEASRETLRQCAVAPGWDSGIWPVREVYLADQSSRNLFADIDLDATFLDLERAEEHAPRLLGLVESASSGLVLQWVAEVFEQGKHVADADRRRLLQWFHRERAAFGAEDLARLARLPIFPTAAGPRPLHGLALPGNFRDELGLARVVTIDEIEEMKPFLVQLGARPLTLAKYCTDYVVEPVASESISREQRHKLVELLATRLLEFRDDPAVRAALEPLKLVNCTDGQWRPGSKVYLTATVREIVGPAVHLAAVPPENRSAHEELFRWLGVAELPRPADIEARCRTLISGPDKHRSIAEAIIRYVGARYREDEPRAQVDFAGLREMAWLPADKRRGRGHRPPAVYATYNRSLFASQAAFLDIPLPVQRETSDFLRWLGVPFIPEPKHVVDHLLWSAQQDEAVGEDVWIYLNRNAADPALDALDGRACLLIADTNTYVKPGDVYWGSHPFGRFRHLLGPKFAEYQALLDRLGVAHQPHPVDAIEVLQDVAARHAGERAPLLEQDVLVVHACWRLLSEGLANHEVTTATLASLQTAEVVLDARSWLRQPPDVFFRDSVSLASRFGRSIDDHLIDRPEGLWSALAAAGVRNLSDAVQTNIVEQRPAPPGGVVAARLAERRRLLLRVLAADDEAAAAKIHRMENEIQLQRLSALVIQQTIELDGTLHPSEAYERGSLFQADGPALLYVEKAGIEPSWVEIAREVVRALHVDASRASSIAAALKGVLGSASEELARRELDELGFRALDEAVEGEADPGVASSLGGSPTDGEAAVDGSEGERDRSGMGTAGREGDGAGQGELSHDDEPPSYEGEAKTSEAGGSVGDGTTGRGSGGEDTREGASVGAGDGSGNGSRSTATTSSTTQSRLRSYVAPEGARSTGGSSADDSDEDDEVERAAVEAVMAYERAHGREPEEMEQNHPGFDIRSVAPDGNVRVIEVKGTAVAWGIRGVPISSPQFEAARQRREEFWLYVVDQALTAPRVHPINDPATKIDQYCFDDMWRAVSEHTAASAPSLPSLVLPTSPEGVVGAVSFRRPEDLSTDTVTEWVACSAAARKDHWFAVRIGGEALGLAHRGGVAFVEPLEHEPEDDELVLVILHDQVDPDTGGIASLRHWRPETDLTGNRLALRLWSSGSVEPLTVTHPEKLTVLGAVKATLTVAELEELGYC